MHGTDVLLLADAQYLQVQVLMEALLSLADECCDFAE
jgi:hypothetical protein